jgi:hypothetical protein
MIKSQVKWRNGSIGVKEFYTYTKEEKNKHIEVILNIPVEDRSTSDDYLIYFYGPRKNNLFIKLDDDK